MAPKKVNRITGSNPHSIGSKVSLRGSVIKESDSAVEIMVSSGESIWVAKTDIALTCGSEDCTVEGYVKRHVGDNRVEILIGAPDALIIVPNESLFATSSD